MPYDLDDDFPPTLDDPPDIDPQYCELLGCRVTAAVIAVYLQQGTKWDAVQDVEGEPLEMLVTDRLRDLIARIPEKGRYRCVARFPDGRLEAQKSHVLRPLKRNEDKPKGGADDESTVNSIVQEMLRDQIRRLERETERLREDLRRERETGQSRAAELRRDREAQVAGLQEQMRAQRDGLTEARVKLARSEAEAEAARVRIADLEALVAERDVIVHEAKAQIESLKVQANDAAFSPLDAITGFDHVLDGLSKLQNLGNG